MLLILKRQTSHVNVNSDIYESRQLKYATSSQLDLMPSIAIYTYFKPISLL